MNEICMRANPERIGAIYILGQLVIWATGRKPNPCYEVRVERSPLRIFPPQYEISQCIEKDVVCPRVLTPYRAAGVFAVPRRTFEAMNGVAIVHVEDGPRKVPVRVIDIAGKRLKELGVGEARGGDVPFPFGPEGGGIPFPFSLSELFEGDDNTSTPRLLTRADVELHTATGYSNSFSFTEAFQDAVGNLPPDENPFPDKLTNVRVIGIGANYGGIAGLNRLYVSVASFY
jgi:hypothetical protein